MKHFCCGMIKMKRVHIFSVFSFIFLPTKLFTKFSPASQIVLLHLIYHVSPSKVPFFSQFTFKQKKGFCSVLILSKKKPLPKPGVVSFGTYT